jgi:hypothetical protein
MDSIILMPHLDAGKTITRKLSDYLSEHHPGIHVTGHPA